MTGSVRTAARHLLALAALSIAAGAAAAAPGVAAMGPPDAAAKRSVSGFPAPSRPGAVEAPDDGFYAIANASATGSVDLRHLTRPSDFALTAMRKGRARAMSGAAEIGYAVALGDTLWIGPFARAGFGWTRSKRLGQNGMQIDLAALTMPRLRSANFGGGFEVRDEPSDGVVASLRVAYLKQHWGIGRIAAPPISPVARSLSRAGAEFELSLAGDLAGLGYRIAGGGGMHADSVLRPSLLLSVAKRF